MNNDKKHEENLALLSNLCTVHLFLEQYERLKGTGYYQTTIKNKGNSFLKSLEPITNSVIYDLYMQDEKLMQLIIGGMEKIMTRLATLSPEKLAMIGDLIEGLEEGKVRLLEADDDFRVLGE